MKERNKAVLAVYVILGERKILIARRCNTGYQDGNYNLPSGHVEDGELPVEAMIREAREEIGITLKAQDIHLVHMSYRPKHDETGNRVDFFFRAMRWSGDVVNAERDKCDDLKWVDPLHLPSNMTPHVRAVIDLVRRGVIYSEFGYGALRKFGYCE